ncbi:hypothetical protein WJX77_008723 [Trebouxia sp. C0004]
MFMLQAAELEQQSDIASAGTIHNLASSTSVDVYKSASLTRQSAKAQRSFMQSTEAPQETRDEVAVIPALALGATQNPGTTMRPGTPKLAKHQAMTMTSVSRSTGRSDKARRAQEQHEQDMLEELDRMHEECATLHEDAKRHQDSYMRREMQWEATLERLKQQLAQLKGDGSHKAAEDTAEGQARQLSTIRDLHKEVVAGIDEAMARHAQETDKVDLLTLKKLKGRVNVLEQQIVTDKAKQLTEDEIYKQRSAALREELDAMRAAATQFDRLHREAVAEVARLKEAQALEQGQAQLLLKQGAALKRENHLLKEDLAAAEAELAGWYETMQRETSALKSIYQTEGHDLLDSPSGAGPGAEGQSPAREGLNSPQATGLVRTMSQSGENAGRLAARQLPQEGLGVALLRHKLASEQQRARTAEASLAAQHQMQELLQTAVQAVQAGGQQQGQGSDSRAASRSNGAVLHTTVSISSRPSAQDLASGDSPFSRPSSASGSRISLSPAGLRAGLASAPRPPPFPISASPQPPTGSQTDSAEADHMHRADTHQHASGSAQGGVHMDGNDTAWGGYLQGQHTNLKGGNQRPQSAKASTQSSDLTKDTLQRPQSATSYRQPPFWTGNMQPQQEEESHCQPADEGCLQQPHPKSGMSQQSVPPDGTTRRRPPSAGQCRLSADTQGLRLAQTPGDLSHEARANSHLSPLRTVPEDMPAAMQAGTGRQSMSAEGRAGSLRAWRGMYSQAGTSEPAREAASATHGGRVSSRPNCAQQQKAGKGKKPSGPQMQPAAINQQQQLARGDSVRTYVSRRTSTPTRSRGRSTLSERPGPTANGFIVDLTDQERHQVVEHLMGQQKFVSLLNSQVCSMQQMPAGPGTLPPSKSKPVPPIQQGPLLLPPGPAAATTSSSEAKPWHVTAAQMQADFLAGRNTA